MDILKKAADINNWVIDLRRDIHRHPEPSFEEVRTSGIVAEELIKMGISVTRIGKTGIFGILEGETPGKVIALRADMDALSVTEETGLPYSSEVNGFMHACGHDAHTAMLLGAAKILSENRNELKGTVKFIFQPAEEAARGAKAMIEGGILKDPDVDMIFGLHLQTDILIGMAVLQEGPIMASGDLWELTIKGKSCHGSSPWQGVDAITCSAAIIQSLQTIVSRVNDATSPIVINIGTINGGERFNIVAGRVKMTGMNRSFGEFQRKSMPEWMENIIKNTCAAYGCEYEFNYDFICAPTINDPEATMFARESVSKIIPEKNFLIVDKYMGSEDFSEYMAFAKGTFMFLGARNEEKDCCYSHHSNKFNVDEDAFLLGIASYVQVAADYLK